MSPKALSEMHPRTVAVPLVGKHRAQSLMRRRMIRVRLQCRLVMRARLVMPVGAKQEVGKVDMPHRVVGMVQDRLCVNAAGGIDCTLACKKRPEFVQRAEIGGPATQDVDEGKLRVVPAVQCGQQYRALNLCGDSSIRAT